MTYITYRELKDYITVLPEELQDTTVTVFDGAMEEYFPVESFCGVTNDVIEDGITLNINTNY